MHSSIKLLPVPYLALGSECRCEQTSLLWAA